MNNREIQAIVSQLMIEFCQATGERELTDISMSINESSMIKSEYIPYFVNKFNQQVKPQYQTEFNNKGGTDAVLTELLNYVKDKSKLLTQKLAREAKLAERKILEKEIWKYTVVQRALTSDETISWRSWLHQRLPGEQESLFNGQVNMRELLAYYWLAASDPKMGTANIPFADVWKVQLDLDVAKAKEAGQDEKAVNEELCKQYIVGSIENFIGVVFEIRRAHNEGVLELCLDQDNPSCGAGTLGRIILRSSIYNALTAIQTPAPRLVPREVRVFIASQLENVDIHAIYRYLSNKLLIEAVAEADAQVFNQWIAAVEQPEKITELCNYLQKNIYKFNLINNIRTKEHVAGILHFELMNLAQRDAQALPDPDFVNSIISVGEKLRGKLVGEIEQRLAANQIISRLRYSIFTLSFEIYGLERLVNNEIIRASLYSNYYTSKEFGPVAKYKINDFFERLKNRFEPQLHELHNALTNQADRNYAEFNNLDTEIRERISNQILNTSQKLSAVMATLERKLTNLQLLAEQSLNTGILQKLSNDLPKYDNKTAYVYYEAKGNTTPQQWATNLLRIAFERDANNALINDEHELERILCLLHDKFKDSSVATYRDFVQRLIAFTNQYFSSMQSEITAFWKIKKHALGLLTKAFNKYHNLINSSEFSFEAKLNNINESLDYNTFSLDFSVLFTTNSANLDDSVSEDYQLILGQVINGAFKPNESADLSRALWISNALALVGDAGTTKIPLVDSTLIHKLYQYVLLTVFKNLGLTDIKLSNAKSLLWLCRCYMTCQEREDQTGSRYTPFDLSRNDTVSFRLSKLVEHLSQLLTTLKPVADLFNSGHICILSSSEASAELYKCDDASALLFRVSNSSPTCLAASVRSGHSYITPSEINYARFFYLITPNLLNTLYVKGKTVILGLIPFSSVLENNYHNEAKAVHIADNKIARNRYQAYRQPTDSQSELQLTVAQASVAINSNLYSSFQLAQRKASSIVINAVDEEEEAKTIAYADENAQLMQAARPSSALSVFASQVINTHAERIRQLSLTTDTAPQSSPQAVELPSNQQVTETVVIPENVQPINGQQQSIVNLSQPEELPRLAPSQAQDAQPISAEPIITVINTQQPPMVVPQPVVRSSANRDEIIKLYSMLSEATNQYYQYLVSEKKQLALIQQSRQYAVMDDAKLQKITEKLKIVRNLKKTLPQLKVTYSNQYFLNKLHAFANELKNKEVYGMIAKHRTHAAKRFLSNALTILFCVFVIPYRCYQTKSLTFWRSNGKRFINKVADQIRNSRVSL